MKTHLLWLLGVYLTWSCFGCAVFQKQPIERKVIASTSHQSYEKMGFGETMWLSRKISSEMQYSDGTKEGSSREELMVCTKHTSEGKARCVPVHIVCGRSNTQCDSYVRSPTRAAAGPSTSTPSLGVTGSGASKRNLVPYPPSGPQATAASSKTISFPYEGLSPDDMRTLQSWVSHQVRVMTNDGDIYIGKLAGIWSMSVRIVGTEKDAEASIDLNVTDIRQADLLE